jgi:hypothetical protein
MDSTLRQTLVAEVRSLDKRARASEPNPGSAG